MAECGNGKHYFMHIAVGYKRHSNQSVVQKVPIDPSWLHRMFTALSTEPAVSEKAVPALQICDKDLRQKPEVVTAHRSNPGRR